MLQNELCLTQGAKMFVFYFIPVWDSQLLLTFSGLNFLEA